MEGKNSFITREGEIVYLGDGVLPYISLSAPRPFAYPADCIKRDDLALLVSRNLTCSEAASLEAVGIVPHSGERCVLFLGAYDDPEVQPVEKYGEELFTEEESVLLDTFFSGNDIKIRWNGRRGLLTVSINGQVVDCRLDERREECPNQLILFGADGIRYFRDDSEKSRLDSLETVLSGERFHGYIREDRLAETRLDALFPKEIVDCIERTGQEDSSVFFREGNSVSVKKIDWPLGNNSYTEYVFTGRLDILEHIRMESGLYRLLQESREEHRSGGQIPNTFRLWGNDANLSQVKLLLQKACDTNVTVLLTGESGTGKTFLAREIHRNGKRREKEFVHVNCAAIPYNLIESELFGYEAGAFTGAKRGGKKGYFEMADGGTIFLDEITELPLPLQGKLLEVIQSRTFYRVGGTEKISVNVRLIAATNRNLKEQAAARAFREDLYYRINVFPIELPPLRKRRDAIHAIVTDILPGICERVELEPLIISPQALEKMKDYQWPGNVRELENVLEKAAIMCDGSVIMPEDVMLSECEGPESRPVTLKEQKELCEKQAIAEALEQCGGDRGMAARRLDIGRTNLFEKMRKYGVGGRWTGGQDDTE